MRIRTMAVILLSLVAPVASRAQMQGRPVGAVPASAPRGEIDDPNSGARWLMYASANGGPGRLVLVSSSRGTAPRGTAQARGVDAPRLPRPVIRAGDRIVLEEHTPVVDARLEAIALGPAAPGGDLRVRLAIGGRTLAAVAVTAGRALLAPEEVQR